MRLTIDRARSFVCSGVSMDVGERQARVCV